MLGQCGNPQRRQHIACGLKGIARQELQQFGTFRKRTDKGSRAGITRETKQDDRFVVVVVRVVVVRVVVVDWGVGRHCCYSVVMGSSIMIRDPRCHGDTSLFDAEGNPGGQK